jgi:hypothetical protein
MNPACRFGDDWPPTGKSQASAPTTAAVGQFPFDAEGRRLAA